MKIDEHADRDETRRCKLMIWFKEASTCTKNPTQGRYPYCMNDINIFNMFFFWKRKCPFNSTDFPYFFTSYQHPFSTWISPTNTNPSHPPADSHHLTLSSGQSEAKRATGTRTPWTWVGHHGSWTLMDLEFAWFLGPWLKWMLCQLRENHGWDSCVCTNEMGGVVWWDVSFIEVVVSWVWVGRC